MAQLTLDKEKPPVSQERARPDGRPVGKILQLSRIHYGLEIADVEAALRIRAMHLIALEEGRSDKLPGRVYAIGFVRAYAEYLGLDGNEIVHLFKSQSTDVERKPEHHFPVPASESKLPNIYILGGSLAALLAAGIGFGIINGKGDMSAAIPSVSEVARVDDIRVGQAPLESAMLSAIETAVGREGPAALVKPVSRITLNVTESAWVEIRNAANKPVLSRIMKAGDSYLVPDEEGLTLSTGNAGVIVLTVDGQGVPPLGAKGDILRNVKLIADVLKPAPVAAPASEAEQVDSSAAGAALASDPATAVTEEDVTDEAPAVEPVRAVVAPKPRSAPAEIRRVLPNIVRSPNEREGM